MRLWRQRRTGWQAFEKRLESGSQVLVILQRRKEHVDGMEQFGHWLALVQLSARLVHLHIFLMKRTLLMAHDQESVHLNQKFTRLGHKRIGTIKKQLFERSAHVRNEGVVLRDVLGRRRRRRRVLLVVTVQLRRGSVAHWCALHVQAQIKYIPSLRLHASDLGVTLPV
jgi:hypothetical protein